MNASLSAPPGDVMSGAVAILADEANASTRRSGQDHSGSLTNRDRLGVTSQAQTARMTYLLICPWCEEEAPFDGEVEEGLVCLACGLRIELATETAAIELALPEAA